MGIVHKAVAAGVPIAAVPLGRDQPEVARRIAESRTGVALPARRLTFKRLRATVREAIALAPHAREASARLRAAGGPRRLADEAEELSGTAARSRTVAV